MLNHTPHSGGTRSLPLLRTPARLFGPTTPAPPARLHARTPPP